MEKGEEYISATLLALELGLKPIQVRKDISCTGIEGKPKIGFRLKELSSAIRHVLGWDNTSDAVIIGAGNMGRALSGYEGFRAYGLRIAGLFDNDKAKIGKRSGLFTIQGMDELASFIKDKHISIAVITVPASAAQKTADFLIKAGIVQFGTLHLKILKFPRMLCFKEQILELVLPFSQQS